MIMVVVFGNVLGAAFPNNCRAFLELRLVAGPDMRKLLSSFADTHAVQAFSAVSEARA